MPATGNKEPRRAGGNGVHPHWGETAGSTNEVTSKEQSSEETQEDNVDTNVRNKTLYTITQRKPHKGQRTKEFQKSDHFVSGYLTAGEGKLLQKARQ